MSTSKNNHYNHPLTKLQFHPSVISYIHYILQPLIDRLSEINIIESLRAWVARNLPELSFKINTGILEITLEESKLEIITYILNLLIKSSRKSLEHHINTITHWDIANNAHKNKIITRLFGSFSSNIPVTLTYNSNTFTHLMSEELLYGTLIGLNNHSDFQLSINNHPIPITILNNKYLRNDSHSKYFGKLSSILLDPTNKPVVISFNTTDFIQGIITGTSWIKSDPNSIIISLYERTGPDNSDNTNITYIINN